MTTDPPKSYLIDMDGVLVSGRTIIPGADRFIERLKARSVEYLVLTNNPIRTPRDLAHRLQAIGLDVPAERIFTSAMATAHFKLGNLTAFVDRNHLCIDGQTEEIMALEPLAEKWAAFGWQVLEIDGHDFDQICDAIDRARAEKQGPTVIICNTVKGKGVDFMENQAQWHYAGLDEGMRDRALSSLGKG